jgi:hypothetical protein
VARVRAFLQREAAWLDRDIARLRRVQAQTATALAEQLEREPDTAAAEGRRTTVAGRLQRRLDDIADKLRAPNRSAPTSVPASPQPRPARASGSARTCRAFWCPSTAAWRG